MHNGTVFHDDTEYQTHRSELVDRAQRDLGRAKRNPRRRSARPDTVGGQPNARPFARDLRRSTVRSHQPRADTDQTRLGYSRSFAAVSFWSGKAAGRRGGVRSGTAQRRFRIAAIDYVQATLLAPLVAKLQTQAPLIDFEIRQPSSDSERDLDAGVLDLLLMPQQPSAPGVIWTPLYRDGYTCVVWSRHRAHRLTLSAFAAMEHVLVAPRERAGGIVDAVLEKNGLSRRVAVQASTFLIVPYLLIGTTRIATVPERMAGELVRAHPLKMLKPPVAIPGFTMCQAWHEIHRNDPGHRWLREELVRASRENGGIHT